MQTRRLRPLVWLVCVLVLQPGQLRLKLQPHGGVVRVIDDIVQFGGIPAEVEQFVLGRQDPLGRPGVPSPSL